jgi:hypothetical protein
VRGENGRPPEAERLAPGVLCRAPNTVLPAGKLHYLGAVMGQFWRANPVKFSRVPKIASATPSAHPSGARAGLLSGEACTPLVDMRLVMVAGHNVFGGDK